MKNNSNFTQAKSIEKLGVIPRSILRTFGRFRLQLWPGIENLVIQEFRISRYQFLVSLKSVFFLLFVPLFINSCSKELLFKPTVEYFWNTQQSTIFLNISQEKHALQQIENFEEKLYFESLIMPSLEFERDTNRTESQGFNLTQLVGSASKLTNQKSSVDPANYFQQKIYEKYLELAEEYNEESIEALANILTDIFTFLWFLFLIRYMKPQLIILKSFVTELLYSFSDTTKSFLLLFITDYC